MARKYIKIPKKIASKKSIKTNDKKHTLNFLQDINKAALPLFNLQLHPLFQNLAQTNIEMQKKLLPLQNFMTAYTNIFSSINKMMKQIDWGKFEKRYRLSMIEDFSKVKDARITAILGQVLAEFWLNIFIKTLFSNSKQIQEMSFDTKRKILVGLGIIDSGLSNDLKVLDDIRAEYAHNFIIKKDNVLKLLKKINRYNNLVKSKKLTNRNGNNVRIRETAKKIISDLMNIEEKYVIEIQKITKAQKAKKENKNQK